MHGRLFIPILLLSVLAKTAFGDSEQDVLADIRNKGDGLANLAVLASGLADQAGQASHIKSQLKNSLGILERHYKCNAVKTVEITPELKMISITFISKTNPIVSILVIAKDQQLVLEQVAIDGQKIVNFDPMNFDR